MLRSTSRLLSQCTSKCKLAPVARKLFTSLSFEDYYPADHVQDKKTNCSYDLGLKQDYDDYELHHAPTGSAPSYYVYKAVEDYPEEKSSISSSPHDASAVSTFNIDSMLPEDVYDTAPTFNVESTPMQE